MWHSPGLVLPFASAIDSELLDPAKLENPQPLVSTSQMYISQCVQGLNTIHPKDHYSGGELSTLMNRWEMFQKLTLRRQDNRLPWAHLPEGEKKMFGGFADENFEQWHKRSGVWTP